MRSIYQSSFQYTSLQSVQMVPSPNGWGWCAIDHKWKPLWTSLLEASKACLELLNAPKPIYLVQAYINVLENAQFWRYLDMFFNYNTLKYIYRHNLYKFMERFFLHRLKWTVWELWINYLNAIFLVQLDKNTSNYCRVSAYEGFFHYIHCNKPPLGKQKWTQKYYYFVCYTLSPINSLVILTHVTNCKCLKSSVM